LGHDGVCSPLVRVGCNRVMHEVVDARETFLRPPASVCEHVARERVIWT